MLVDRKRKGYVVLATYGRVALPTLVREKVWPCSSVGGAAVIKPEGRGFNSHPGQSCPLSFLVWAQFHL